MSSTRPYLCDAYTDADGTVTTFTHSIVTTLRQDAAIVHAMQRGMEACWNRSEYRVSNHTYVCGEHRDAGIDIASCYQDVVLVTELATGDHLYYQ